MKTKKKWKDSETNDGRNNNNNKKKNPEILNFEYLVQFTHSYHLKRTKAFIFLFSLFCVAFGL